MITNLTRVAFYLCLVLGTATGAETELSTTYDPATLKMAFTNHSEEEIRILRPLDGSEWCWIYPYYRFTVEDSAGNLLKPNARCGNFGFPYSETKWPEDYLIVIPPSQTATVSVYCPMRLEEGETYKISVEYVFVEDARPTNGYPFPEDLWIGTVKTKSAAYTEPTSNKATMPLRSRDESEDPFK